MTHFEKAGLPTVSFTARLFERDALATAKAFGLDRLNLAVVDYSFTNMKVEDIRSAVDSAIDGIIASLTKSPGMTAQLTAFEKPANIVRVEGEDVLAALDNLNRRFLEEDWSDGFPVVAPTQQAVERMLGGTRRGRDELVAILEPGMGMATVEKIAINCVMAGCRPEHLPVLIAAVEAISDPQFRLRHGAMSTGPHAPIMVVNGPISKDLKMNSGQCVLGPGSPSYANTVMGRALRLIYMNIGHCYPTVMDMDTIGSPTKYSMCVSENEEANPWQSMHLERGFDASDGTVTVFTVYGISDVHDFESKTPEGILATVAGTAVNPGVASTARWLRHEWTEELRQGDAILLPPRLSHQKEENLILLGPDHARIIAEHGWSKNDAREYVHHHALIPLREVLRISHRGEVKPEWHWGYSASGDFPIPVAQGPECYEVVVVGGAAGRSAYLYGAHRSVTRKIDPWTIAGVG